MLSAACSCRNARDESLVLAAGVDPRWLADPAGVRIENFPTEYGRLSYSARSSGERLVFVIDGDCAVPPGGVLLVNPTERPIRAVRVNGIETRDFTERGVHLETTHATVEIAL